MFIYSLRFRFFIHLSNKVNKTRTWISKQSKKTLNKTHTWLIFAGVSLHDAIVEPHVRNSHSILRQGSSLVRADGRRRAESLHCLEVLDETVLTSHTFCSQSKTHLKDDYICRLLLLIFSFRRIFLIGYCHPNWIPVNFLIWQNIPKRIFSSKIGFLHNFSSGRIFHQNWITV